MERPSTQTISDLIVEAATSAIMPRFQPGRATSASSHTKADHSLVTAADADAERILTDTLKKLTPGFDVLGEEDSAGLSIPEVQKIASKMTFGWTVDPLDGTRAFASGSPYFATMVSEIWGGQIARAWIYLPVTREMFTVEDGRVFLNGAAMVRGLSPHQSIRGISYTHPASSNHKGFLSGRGSGSVGVDYTHLARGVIDFVSHKEPKPWDHFPGTLMIRALGGVARVSTGTEYPCVNHGARILTAVDKKTWTTAAQHMFTQFGASYVDHTLPPCLCRLGTGLVNPECGLHQQDLPF